MPIIQSKRQINPLSINGNVSIGVAFPLDDVNLFSGTQTVKEQVKTNLLNVLLTNRGERINQPNFGVGLKNILFEQGINEDEVYERINQQIKIYIPEIYILEIKVQPVEDENLLYILISYGFNLDGTEDSIQLNFN